MLCSEFTVVLLTRGVAQKLSCLDFTSIHAQFILYYLFAKFGNATKNIASEKKGVDSFHSISMATSLRTSLIKKERQEFCAYDVRAFDIR